MVELLALAHDRGCEAELAEHLACALQAREPPDRDALRAQFVSATIVGEQAADLLAEYVLAMQQGIGLNKILGTIHIYPTLAEANKYAAGNWKCAHAPPSLLAWVGRFHDWRRG